MMEIVLDNYFNLKDTVTCGQIFRFTEEDDLSYTIVINDRVINVKQEDNLLYVKSNKLDDLERVIKNYFDLDRDYDEINRNLIDMNGKISDIVNKCLGLRMIKQDYFETIIAYIISQNNRVTMISNCLNNIASSYGKRVSFMNKTYYLFPSSMELSNVAKEDFRKLKVGFRDEYLVNIIRAINNKKLDIDSINNMNSSDALKLLMSYKGIGEKVASCILLFAYQKFDVFPIDTWVKKYMLDNYNISDKKKIKEYVVCNYGKYCGIAIQYMFHSKRNK